MLRDLTSKLAFTPLLSPVDKAGTTAKGDWFDVTNSRSPGILFLTGNFTTTDGSHKLVCTMEENDSPLDLGATVVSDEDSISSPPTVSAAAGKNSSTLVGYRGEKRYIRPVFTFTGANASSLVGAYGVSGYPREMPPTAPVAVATA